MNHNGGKFLRFVRELGACSTANLREIARLKKECVVLVQLLAIAQGLACRGERRSPKKKRFSPPPLTARTPAAGSDRPKPRREKGLPGSPRNTKPPAADRRRRASAKGRRGLPVTLAAPESRGGGALSSRPFPGSSKPP